MDRIDRIKAMQKEECGMMNDKLLSFIHHSSIILLHCFYPVYPVHPVSLLLCVKNGKSGG
jgi:hypothetical protein